MRKRLALAIGAALMMAAVPVVFSFPFGRSWHMPANGVRAGAGGIYGTGSTTEWGITCAHCHIEGAGLIDAVITPNPAWTDLGGGELGYQPGQTYDITFTMTGEHRGLNQGNNNLNGFALMIEDANGGVIRGYQTDSGASSDNCPQQYPQNNPNGTTYVYGDCHGVLFIPVANITQWRFSWTAPAQGSGPLNVYWGVVDGSSGGDNSKDDDVKQGIFTLAEGN